jgi:VWFA-related protein
MRAIVCSFLVLGCAILAAQQAPVQATEQASAELTTRETPATFRTKVNLVLVPVVVRDAQGRAIGTLKREDFQLFDRGKLQDITRFSVEKAGSPPPPIVDDTAAINPEEPKPSPSHPAPVIAERFTAYVFDDVHMSFGDLGLARDAAIRHLATLAPTERAAIYTSSGQTILEFTDDRAQLQATLLKLQPRSKVSTTGDCPSLTYYMADLIVNKNDQAALQAASAEAAECVGGPAAQAAVQSAANRILSMADMETRYSLEILRKAVHRIAGMPGQRSLVLISDGFITPGLETEVSLIVDSAIRSGVTINTIDSRGLYTTGTVLDASERNPSAAVMRTKLAYLRDAALVESNVLGELAEGTNGVFFRNNNDMNEGFSRTSSAPEYSYLLGFSPQNLKLDGNYHALKVKLNDGKHLTLQARRGYYAPKHLADPAEEAKHEIEEALFSRETLQDIPSRIQTQFFKSSDFEAKLSVLAKIDIRQLHFRKEAGRNRDDLTVVCALFDRNGNFVKADSKTVEMRIKDATLDTKLNGGITIRTSFDVKTGSYVIRLVVRDAEGQLMSAQNGSIEIP